MFATLYKDKFEKFCRKRNLFAKNVRNAVGDLKSRLADEQIWSKGEQKHWGLSGVYIE